MRAKSSAGTRGSVPRRPLWECPRCGRRFANTNQSHACAPLDLDRHFSGKPPAIRALFDRFHAHVLSVGPVLVLPEKTRIAFQVRMSFAQVTPRKNWLAGHLVLSRRRPGKHIRRIEAMSPRCYVHHFRIDGESDLDGELMSLIREAYAVGEQRR
jgi:hypothetical protein